MACPLDIFLTEIKIVSYCVLNWPNPLEVYFKYLYSYNKVKVFNSLPRTLKDL